MNFGRAVTRSSNGSVDARATVRVNSSSEVGSIQCASSRRSGARRRQLEALLAQLARLAVQQPVLMLFEEQAVVGETPNLAARLQALAEPGTVVIAPSTRRLTGGLFDYEDLGAVELKGLGASVMAARVLRGSAAASRFEALHGRDLTPLVGRDEELALLQRRWQQAKAGGGADRRARHRQIASRAAMLQQVAGEPHTRLRYFCSPHHQASALHPFITQLEHAAGFSREDMAEARLAKLEALLALSNAGAEEIGFIAERMSVPTGDKYRLPDLRGALADQIADDHQPGGDADPHLQWRRRDGVDARNARLCGRPRTRMGILLSSSFDMAVGWCWLRTFRSVAAVATGRVDRLQLLDVELGDCLQLLRQPGCFEIGGKVVQPGAVIVLQLDQRGDCCRPAPWPWREARCR